MNLIIPSSPKRERVKIKRGQENKVEDVRVIEKDDQSAHNGVHVYGQMETDCN